MRFTYLSFSFLLAALLLSASCKFNPDIQGEGFTAVQGIWEEEPAKYSDSLLQYTRHQFKFTCDSFYVTLETTSKVNYYDDSCFNNGHWKEYAKGNYAVRNDTLYFNGTFTKANFKQKLSGCYRTGQYIPAFLIKYTSPEKIELLNLQQNISVVLKLKEKIKCDPQPL